MTPIDAARVRTVLVVKPDHVGDLMLAVPALARIRSAFPGARIDVLGLEPVHAFSVAHGLADRVVPFASPWFSQVLPRASDWGPLTSTVRRLRAERYDVAINLRHDLRDMLLTAAVGARWSVSYRYRGRAPGITHGLDVDPNEHESRRWLRLLEGAEIRGADRPFVPRSSADSEAVVDAALQSLPPDRPRIGIHARSRTAAKNWPADRWIDLARRIQKDRGASVVLIGTDADREANAEVAAGLDRARCVDASGLLPLADLPALVHRLALLVGVDSGPAHLAGLCGVPVVVLFSRTNSPRRWRPMGDRVRVLRSKSPCPDCEARALDHAGHHCMAEIAVDEVARVVQDVLRSVSDEPINGGGR